jgi:hypothetical protein
MSIHGRSGILMGEADSIQFSVEWISRIFHQSLAPAAMCVLALNRTHRCIEKILPINARLTVFVNIFSMSRKFDFFPEKTDHNVMA